jgi:c-di-GMP-binding flagellar brake protein YcgR
MPIQNIMKALDPVDTIDPNVSRRSSLRLKTERDEPVYLQVILGAKISLLVTEIGGGGAQILCRKCEQFFDDFDAGQFLGKCVLILREQGMVEVEPVIRWKQWPVIGVQFIDLSDKDRAQIFRFLFELERKKIKRMNMEPKR